MLASHADRSPFPHEVVGFHSNNGCRPGTVDDTFQLKINQDRAAVSFIPANLIRDDIGHQMVLQVYDGHGPDGEMVSDFATRKLLDALREDEARLIASPEDALGAAVVRVDELLEQVLRNKCTQ